MSKHDARVKAFFDAYEKIGNDALVDESREDADGLAASFAPYFVESSPKGVMGGANDHSFRDAAPKGWARYRAVGGKAMTIKGLAITYLNDQHAMARIDWDFDYVRADGKAGTVSFQNLYFLTLVEEAPKIFAYVTPDEEQAMKDHGLA